MDLMIPIGSFFLLYSFSNNEAVYHRPLNHHAMFSGGSVKSGLGSKRKADVEAFLTKEEVNRKPVRRYSGKTILVDSRDQLKPALKRISSEKVLGFDTETRPSFRKGEQHSTALIQLAGNEVVLVIRLNRTGLRPALREILASKDVIKAGIAPGRDVEELKELSYFKDSGFVDLAQMATERGLKNGGLKSLAANLLGYRVSKSMRTSNWESETLSDSQIVYAATDAWVSRELYFALNELKIVENPDDAPQLERKKSGNRRNGIKNTAEHRGSKACQGN